MAVDQVPSLWVGLGPGRKLHTDMACLAEVLSSKKEGIAEVDRECPRGHKEIPHRAEQSRAEQMVPGRERAKSVAPTCQP